MTAAPHAATQIERATPSPAILGFYAGHSHFSSPGRHSGALDAVPSSTGDIARIIPGLVLYEHVAEPFYGCIIPDARRAESHIRPVEAILEAILALDGRPLAEPRPPEARLVGVCRHYALLAVSLLRQHGVPARARSGFARYFDPTTYEDHWVCEYWRADEGRWALLDAQLDEVFRGRLGIGFDGLDVPRDQFLPAGEAWRRCRAGELDPQAFGIGFVKLHGLWFIAASLVRDVAALNKVEVLPWDAWGAIPRQDGALSSEQLAFFDGLAVLSAEPDRSFTVLRQRFEEDDRVRVPHVVVNSLRQREEPALTLAST